MKSVYIHIPFCNTICTYCDFCKIYKMHTFEYLEALKLEIEEKYQGEKIKTLYFGGGTPSVLNQKELEKLFEITKIFNLNDAEITFECNSTDLEKEKLEFLEKHVNRLSIGVQSFNKKFLKLLDRDVNVENIKLAKKYFNNINIDLMYGFKNQTENDLIKDLDKIIELEPDHISIYNLILEPHTKLFIENYEIEENNFEDCINKKLNEKGYTHYEISNYAKNGKQSKHNLTYWDNENYYGFGLGASGYINNIRYENTKSLNKYLKREYIKEEKSLDLNETLQNEFILGLRKTKGINKKKFYQKYKFDIYKINILKELSNYLEDDGKNIFLKYRYLYLSNEILLKFVNINLLEH